MTPGVFKRLGFGRLPLENSTPAFSAPSALPPPFLFLDVPLRLQRLTGGSDNTSLVRGGCLDPMRGAETTVTRTFQIA